MLHHTYNYPAFPTVFSTCHTSVTCVQRSSACVDMCVWVGLEMTSILYCVGSQLDSCSIINGTIEILTLCCPVGEVPEFKRLAEGVTDCICKTNDYAKVMNWLTIKLAICRPTSVFTFIRIMSDQAPYGVIWSFVTFSAARLFKALAL